MNMASVSKRTKPQKKSKDISAKNNQKTTGLRKCFAALVDRKQVNLEIDVLKLVLKYELLINLDSLPPDLAEVMPLMLVVYIKNWPGWQKSKEYYSGNLNFRDWFDKFRQYIVVRLNYVIKNGYGLAVDMIKEETKKECSATSSSKEFKESGSQTDYLVPKKLAPFSILIEGRPSLTNSLQFSHIADDILLTKTEDKGSPKVTSFELLNWPYISIEFFSPELHFRRKNTSVFSRYLHTMNTPLEVIKGNFIEEIDLIETGRHRYCFTANLINIYMNEYISILSSLKDINKSTVNSYKTICREFLKDIEEIGVNNTIATNTKVVFNIGNKHYVRSSKLENKNSTNPSYTGNVSDVVYYEQVTPRMETSFYYFKAIQDITTKNVSFSYLNILKASAKVNNSVELFSHALPVINYTCTFCDANFTTVDLVIKHLNNVHKHERDLSCTSCKKIFSVNKLAQTRWHHECSS